MFKMLFYYPSAYENNVIYYWVKAETRTYKGRVFTSNSSLAKINCHINFGKVFAFTHSNEKLKKIVEESLLTYFVT